MIGLVASLALTGLLIFLSYQEKHSLGRLVQVNLAMIPLFPITLFLHHNLDPGVSDPYSWYLLLPLFTSLALLIITWGSMLNNRSVLNSLIYFFSPLGVCLLAYIFFTVISSFYSYNVKWSFYALLWTLPFAFLFFFFGRMRTIELEKPYFSYSVILTCLIAFCIVGFALYSGRATSVFNTRSFGSILSTTGSLQMLTLFVPLASVENRKNKFINLFFWTFPLGIFSLSLSRSVVVPLVVYLSTLYYHYGVFIIRSYRKNAHQYLNWATVFLAFVAVMAYAFGSTWTSRFEYMPFAISGRLEAFGYYWNFIFKGSPFFGVGYGQTKYFHPNGYSDLHNLLLTEFFENGVGAGFFILVLLLISLFYALCSLKDRKGCLLGLTVICAIALAHIQGCNLSIRHDAGYNTPYFMCMLFYLIGRLETDFFTKDGTRVAR